MIQSFESSNLVQKGPDGLWFTETSTLWPGQAMSLEVEEILYEGRTKYQDVLVLKTKSYGMALVLDGVIQVTERDEFSYQEMIAHLPLNCHPNPERVLVIGGGDGGVLRELVKNPSVKHITLCEIDEKVIELSKTYLPSISVGFQDPRVTTYIGDGFKFMGENLSSFDVIITDSSDPVGPASSLFDVEYYRLMKNALKPNGIVCTQGECVWLHLDLISSLLKVCNSLFSSVDYAYTTIPTYPSGQIGFVLCSLDPTCNFREPKLALSEKDLEDLQMKYYSTPIHKAAFVLPRFAAKALSSLRPSQQ
eukprot:Sdes_comp23787_c0_seq1m21945